MKEEKKKQLIDGKNAVYVVVSKNDQLHTYSIRHPVQAGLRQST